MLSVVFCESNFKCILDIILFLDTYLDKEHGKTKKKKLSYRTNHFFLLFRITFTYISKMDSKKDEDNQSLEDLPDEILTLIFGFLIEKRSHEFGILVSTGNCFHAESSSGFLIEKKNS